MATDAKMNIAGFSSDISLDSNVTFNKRILGKQGDSVSASNYMTLGDGNYFLIHGSATLKAIHKDGWTNGSVIYLAFDDACDIEHMSAFDPNYYSFYMRSASTVSVSSDNTIPFIFDSDNLMWRCLDSSL